MKIITADGFEVQPGDRVFNYYDMEDGKVTTEPASDGWFTFVSEFGRHRTLNGDRICTVTHAQQMGWLPR